MYKSRIPLYKKRIHFSNVKALTFLPVSAAAAVILFEALRQKKK
jgi:tRNA G18 (ribose-2'-O)-methylase SpoU